MISRYSRKELTNIWSEENKYKIWLDIEIAAAQAMEKLGYIPRGVSFIVKKKGKINVKRIHAIETKVKHDVIAFLTNMAENIGPESRFIHMGMTSSDLLDTSLALLCKEAGELILEKVKIFKQVLRDQAVVHRESFQIGRSHWVHAEPITFGLKLALWSEEMGRHINRWERAVESISTGKISGAVGTYQHLDPEVEDVACKKLGLQPASIPVKLFRETIMLNI